MTAIDPSVDRMTEILVEHQLLNFGCCTCSPAWVAEDRFTIPHTHIERQHRAHVASVLHEWMQDQLAEAWDEGWNSHARGQVTEARFDPYQWNKNPYARQEATDE